MSDKSPRRRFAGAFVAIGLAMVAGFALARYKDASSGIGTGQSATPTPQVFPHPMLDASDALDRSVDRFPEGTSPHGELVRLVSCQTFSDTIRTLSPSWEPHVPLWVVAMLGDDLTVNDVLDSPVPPGDANDEDPAAIGAYYVWDANSGQLAAEFAITDYERYSQLAALQDEALHIAAATKPPEPSPEPTQ